MSFIIFGNLPASVPPVLDTTPCLDQMVNYEECIADSDDFNRFTTVPSYPSVFPRLFTTGIFFFRFNIRKSFI